MGPDHQKALPPEMLSSQVPADVRRFCPRFYEMGETDKRTFWAYFFQALAGAEAGLNPNTSVRHTEPDVTKRDEVRGRPYALKDCCSLHMQTRGVMAAISIGKRIGR